MKIQRQHEQFKIFAEQQPGELTGWSLAMSKEGRPHSEMTPDEHKSINSYYAFNYGDINNHLRGIENPYGCYGIAKKRIPHIDSLMDKTPEFTRPVYLHRGMDRRATDKVFGEPGDKVGKVFQENGYTSTTAEEDKLDNFFGNQTHLHIHAGPGTKALNENHVTKNGWYTKGDTGYPAEHIEPESEFTFPHGQRFKVLHDEQDENTRHIHLKALAPHEETNLEHFSKLKRRIK